MIDPSFIEKLTAEAFEYFQDHPDAHLAEACLHPVKDMGTHLLLYVILNFEMDPDTEPVNSVFRPELSIGEVMRSRAAGYIHACLLASDYPVRDIIIARLQSAA